jgi:hypothetical protein
MIKFNLKDDQGRWAVVDNTDDAIMWMLGKTGVSVEVYSNLSGHDGTIPAAPFDGLPAIPTVGKVS